MDKILTINIETPQDILLELCERFKSRRLALHFTQEGLAKRAGMSWSSLKRFEHTGQISFESLLKLALVLECLNEFSAIGKTVNYGEERSLDAILSQKKKAKRGYIT